MKKYLDLTSWVLLFFFAPITVLILLSQNSLPGDLFYPVKRGLENVILAAVSVSPATKVAFRTDLTQRRFTEAQQLLLARRDTSGLNTLVSEVSQTQQEISTFSDPVQKKESSQKLIVKIDEYEEKLTQVQTQISSSQQTFQTAPSSTSESSNPNQTQTTAVQTQNPLLQQPTKTTSPTTIPTAVPTPAPTAQPGNGGGSVGGDIDETKDELEKLKEKLKKAKADADFREKVKEEEQKLKQNSQNQQKEEKQSETPTPTESSEEHK